MLDTNAKEAVLLKKIDISNAGYDCFMRVGDLNGDGIADIIMLQPNECIDERYFPRSVASATAYTIDGELLWQIGTPRNEKIKCENDLPAQIYDIDRDGNNEFLCVMEGYFCVFDGKSGELKRRSTLPDPQAHDAFAIADLQGLGYPQNIIIKNRYHQLWALDKNFNVMWTYRGNIGHYPIVCDINCDGRDEIIAGSVVLDSQGNVLWEIEGEDFPKSICVADLGMSGEALIVAGGEKTRVFDSEGNEKWSFKNELKTSCLAAGNVRPDTFGFEIMGFFEEIDEGEKNSGVFLTDYRGNTLFKEKGTKDIKRDYICAIHNFDGRGGEHIVMSSRSENLVCIYDGYMNPAYTIEGGKKIFIADIFSDGEEEILLYDNEKVYIYSAHKKEVTKLDEKKPRPQTRGLYNYTRFPYVVADSARNAFGYAVGQFVNPDIRAWAKQCALSEETEFMSKADFCIVLVSATGIKRYSTEVFSDVSKNDYFYPAISTLKEYGYIDDVVGRFNPYEPVSAEFALDIVQKAAGFIPLTTKNGEDLLTKQDVAKLILQVYDREATEEK